MVVGVKHGLNKVLSRVHYTAIQTIYPHELLSKQLKPQTCYKDLKLAFFLFAFFTLFLQKWVFKWGTNLFLAVHKQMLRMALASRKETDRIHHCFVHTVKLSGCWVCLDWLGTKEHVQRHHCWVCPDWIDHKEHE